MPSDKKKPEQVIRKVLRGEAIRYKPKGKLEAILRKIRRKEGK